MTGPTVRQDQFQELLGMLLPRLLRKQKYCGGKETDVASKMDPIQTWSARQVKKVQQAVSSSH